MLIRSLFVFAILTVAAIPARAADPVVKFSVSVDHSGDDSVGKMLAFSLRDAIASSSRYKLAQRNGVFRISLVTLDLGRSDSPGLSTAAAVTFTSTNGNALNDRNPDTWYPIFLSSSVAVVGVKRVDQQAKAILASMDSAIESYHKDYTR
jgi:hypothetical protein